MADRIEVDYTQLEKLSGVLTQRAEIIENQINRLRQVMDGLRSSWKGEASDDFFAEFEERAMPSMRRLHDVLTRTGQTLRQISQTYRQAEEQAGNLFKGGGVGSVVGTGTGGGVGMPSTPAGGGGVTPSTPAGDSSVGDGSVMPTDAVGSVNTSFTPSGAGGDSHFTPSGAVGGGGGSFSTTDVAPNGAGASGSGGVGGGRSGGFGGGSSSFASEQLSFKGGAVTNGFNTVRDATTALNAPTPSTNLDPRSGKVLGKAAMPGGLAGIGDSMNVKDFVKDFFNVKQAQLEDLVNTVQGAFSSALQAINAFADLVDALF